MKKMQPIILSLFLLLFANSIIASSPSYKHDVEAIKYLIRTFSPNKSFQSKDFLAIEQKKDDETVYTGIYGNVEIEKITVKNNLVQGAAFKLKGKRVDRKVLPFLQKMYGVHTEFDRCNNEMQWIGAFGAKIIDIDARRYYWDDENKKIGFRILLESYEDVLYESGGMRKVIPKATKIQLEGFIYVGCK